MISSDKTLSSEKNDDHWNLLSSFESMVISQNIVHTLLPEFRWSRQRENLWTAIPAVNSWRNVDFTKFVNDYSSRNGCRINTTEPNQMILVSFFLEDNVLSDEYATFSNIKVTKIERSAFLDTRYSKLQFISCQLFEQYRYGVILYAASTSSLT